MESSRNEGLFDPKRKIRAFRKIKVEILYFIYYYISVNLVIDLYSRRIL